MQVSIIVFALWALAAAALLFLTLGKEFGFEWSGFRQAGDTTLGHDSVNWMAALALGAAVWIYFFLA